MAKAQALDWKAFMGGEIKPKVDSKTLQKVMTVSLAVIAGATVLTYALPAFAAGKALAVTVMAPSFEQSLSHAAAPIHGLIRGFAHEIYAIFMGWGAIEAMIGKPQQGFTRMKTATLGYVLLYWVPTIIELVNKARPGV